MFYTRPIRCETPTTLMSFFGNLDNHLRAHLRHIEIRQYVKKDAKNALTFLAEAKFLERLRLEVDVVKDDDPVHAAAMFWPDVCKLLEAVGSRIEKSMVPPRKAMLTEAEVQESQDEDEEILEEEQSDKEDEDEDEDEGEDNETEKSDESAKSDNAETKDSKDSIAESIELKGAEDVKTDTTESDDHKHDNIKAEGIKAEEIIAEKIKAEDTNTSVAAEKTSDTVKQDSKSPGPAAPVKQKTVQPEPPKLIQGKKCFAVDILNFGPAALKNKDNTKWNNAQKQLFLKTLEGKLK